MKTKALIVALALFAPVAAVSPGLMRREPEGNVAMIEKPKSKLGGSCDEKSDSNCCLTQAAIDHVKTLKRFKNAKFRVGQCASGAMWLAGPEAWSSFWKKLETCKTDVCKAKNVHSGGKGTCEDYICPKGWKAKKQNVASSPCPSAMECNFNCCHVDINHDPEQKKAILAFGALWAVTNVTKFSNQIGFPIRHTHLELDEDLQQLNDSINGLYKLMNDINPENKKYCPPQKSEDDYSHANHIRECVDLALCEIAENSRTKEDVKLITMLREYYSKFEEVTWDYLWENLKVQETLIKPGKWDKDPQDHDEVLTLSAGKSRFGDVKIDFMEAAELECLGVSGFLKTLGRTQLLEAGKAGAYQASKALNDAARATHALMNRHEESDNSSMDATIAALHRAWEPACKLLNCDHTNYWSLVGASDSHSIALIESGASVNHMSVHVRTRARLDKHMQMFLSRNGKHASKFYRTEGTRTEAQRSKYGSYLKTNLKSIMIEYPKKYGLDHTLLSLFDRESLQKYATTNLQSVILRGLQNDNIYLVQNYQQLNELKKFMVLDAKKKHGQASKSDEQLLAELMERSLWTKGAAKVFEDIFQGTVRFFEAIPDRLNDAAGWAMDTASAGLRAVNTHVIEPAEKVVKETIEDVVDIVVDVWEAAEDIVEDIANTVVAITTAAINGAADLGKKIAGYAATALNVIGEVIVTVATEIGGTFVAFYDFIINTFGCIAWGVVNGIGYGKKFPCPPPLYSLICPQPTNVACTTVFGVALSLAMTFDITAMLKGYAVYGVAITITVVIGMIPGGPTGMGGLRIGLGVAAGLVCPPYDIDKSRHMDCVLQINVGSVASVVIPLPPGVHSPRCILGPCLLGFTCSESFGLVMKILCCSIRLTDGCADCSTAGKCNPAETAPLPPHEAANDTPDTRSKLDAKLDKLVVTGEDGSCKENLQGRGFNYRGCTSRTQDGIECQMWSSQYPHRHSMARFVFNHGRCGQMDQKECQLSQRGLGNHNLCRNPMNNQPTIWCFTKNPNRRWNYCDPMGELVRGMTKVTPNVFVRKSKWNGDWKKAVYILFGGRFQRFCTFGAVFVSGRSRRRILCNMNYIGNWEKFGIEIATLTSAQEQRDCFQNNCGHCKNLSRCKSIYATIAAQPRGGKVDRKMFAARETELGAGRYPYYWSMKNGVQVENSNHRVASAYEQFRVGPPASSGHAYGYQVNSCYGHAHQSYACLGSSGFSIQNVKTSGYCKDVGNDLICQSASANSLWLTFRTRRVGYKMETNMRSPGGHIYPMFTNKAGQWFAGTTFGQPGTSRF